MLRDVKDITVKGGPFKEETLLESIISGPFNILYGINGSGKTTISRHFIENNEALYGNKAFVFNDKFILDNISIREDGVRAIAMLGSQAIAEDKHRDELKQIMSDCEADIERAKVDKQTNEERIVELKEKILEQLNNPKDGYQKRIVLSRGKKLVTKNNMIDEYGLSDIMGRFRGLKSDDYDQGLIRSKVNRLVELLSPMGDGNKRKLVWSKPETISSESLKRADYLLRKVIEKPLTQRDEIIIDMVCASEIRDRIVNAGVEKCPLCHQTIGNDYKERLTNMIRAFFNKEAEEFQNEIDLTIANLSPIEFDVSSLHSIFNDLIDKLQTQQTSLADKLEKIKNALREKKTHLYEPMNGVGDIDAILLPIKYLLGEIESKVDNYNKSIDEYVNNRNEFDTLNLILAYFESKSEIDEFFAAREAIAVAVRKAEETSNRQKQAERELQKMSDASRKDLYTAMNFINGCLSMVFFDDMHLTLKVESGSYVVKVRGNDVTPDKLSLGERNVLAMAYFFATIFTGKTDEEKFQDEVMVVIDDPISSFDDYNRVGMIVMMGRQIEQILCGNRNSKVLVMTHDFNTVAELYRTRYKTLTNVYCQWNKDEYYVRENLPFYRLINNKIEVHTKLDRTEYSRMLERLWNFAKSECEEEVAGEVMVIGNLMRRLTEQYTKFNGLGNIDDAFVRFSHKIQDESIKSYYSKSPTRVWLNGDSHGSDDTFNYTFSYEEKRKLARAIFYFFACINRFHLRAQLEEKTYKEIQAKFDFTDDTRTRPNHSFMK